MLDEESIERIVEQVLRRLLTELADDDGVVRLSAAEVARATASLRGAVPARVPSASPRARKRQDHPGSLLSEDEVVRYFRSGIRVVVLAPRCIITPSAKDRARDLQVDLVEA